MRALVVAVGTSAIAQEEATGARRQPGRVHATHAPWARAKESAVRYNRSVTPPEMLEQIMGLPVAERAKLALELLRSLDGEPEAGATEAWDTEIERRAAEVEAGTADTMTLEEYRAHVRGRRHTRER